MDILYQKEKKIIKIQMVFGKLYNKGVFEIKTSWFVKDINAKLER